MWHLPWTSEIEKLLVSVLDVQVRAERYLLNFVYIPLVACRFAVGSYCTKTLVEARFIYGIQICLKKYTKFKVGSNFRKKGG